MQLNEAVLGANGGAWDRPPERPVIWGEEHKARRDELLSDYPDDLPWGIKDPRFLFTLAGWREVLPTARLVGTFRHPLSVAQSLLARNKMPISAGLALWTKYNEVLLDIVRNGSVPLVCFDEDADVYRHAVTKVIRFLGLTPPQAQAEFFDPNLRHQSARVGAHDVQLPQDARSIYKELCNQAAA